MPFNMADMKTLGRRAVNDYAAVLVRFYVFNPATKTYEIPLGGPEVKARYHSVIKREGLIEGEGGERLIEIDRIVYDRDGFAALGIVPKKFDKIEFIAYGVTVMLDVKKPHDGPVEETWFVTML